MDYPLISKNEETFPKEPICPVCKREKVFEPHNFICLTGGARILDKKGNSRGVDNHLGFLDITWHGHHYENKNDETKDAFAILDIVKDSLNGQFELYFCSKDCFKKWIDELLTEVERKAFNQ